MLKRVNIYESLLKNESAEVKTVVWEGDPSELRFNLRQSRREAASSLVLIRLVNQLTDAVWRSARVRDAGRSKPAPAVRYCHHSQADQADLLYSFAVIQLLQ